MSYKIRVKLQFVLTFSLVILDCRKENTNCDLTVASVAQIKSDTALGYAIYEICSITLYIHIYVYNFVHKIPRLI
jgi:hypothetical protein